MLEIKNLSIVVDCKYLVRDLSIILNRGDKVAIIGEEGNGKTTLLKVIAGLCDYAEVSGSIQMKENRLGYLKQFFDEFELEMSVYDYLFADSSEYYQRVKKFYRYQKELEIGEHLLDLEIKNLSGGEKIKVGLVKLLIDECDILLLDEPTNDLDLETLHWLESFIIRSSQPIIFISHDETLLSKTANKILHMELVKKKQECRHTILKTTYEEYLLLRASGIEKQTQIARSEQNQFDRQMQKLTQIKQKVDHQLATITRADAHGAQLLKKKMKSITSQEKRIQKKDLTEVPDLEESICLFFENAMIPSKKQILNIMLPELRYRDQIFVTNLQLTVIGPEHVIFVGKNGVGKTTLMREIYQNLKNREDIRVGYMPQFYEDILVNSQTPLDYLCPNSDKNYVSYVRTLLGNLNITTEEMTQSFSLLSGGTKAKIFLLKFVIDECNVLLLDEPTRNLSPLSTPVIRKMLADFQGTIISVSHDRKYIKEVCNTIYELTPKGLKKIEKENIL